MKHDYSSAKLPALLEEAYAQYVALAATLHEIQTLTGIPGLHTDINSDDPTPGVLERIQDTYDNPECSMSLEVFRSFDED